MERSHREPEFLSLPMAAGLVCMQVLGKLPDATAPGEMQQTLDYFARAIAALAPIYAANDDPAQLPTEIPAIELIEGAFYRGANVFKSRSGAEYRNLLVQRKDVDSAVEILRARVNWSG
jgi:hypothetical protein